MVVSVNEIVGLQVTKKPYFMQTMKFKFFAAFSLN